MRVIGFTIEGLSKNGSIDDVAFVFGSSDEAVEEFERRADYAVIPALKSNIGSIDTRIEAYKLVERYSSYQFNLVASDEVGQHLFQKARKAVANLTEDVDADSTTLNIDDPDLDSAPFDAVADGVGYNKVFIGQELIYIPEDSGDGAGEYTGVLRGQAGSRPLRYQAGVNVFDKIPSWVGREVQIFDWEPDRGVQVREPQQIQDPFKQTGGRIVVKTKNFLSNLKNQAVNRTPCDIRVGTGGDIDVPGGKVEYTQDYTNTDERYQMDPGTYFVLDSAGDTKLFKDSVDLTTFAIMHDDWATVLSGEVGDSFSPIYFSDNVRDALWQPFLGEDDIDELENLFVPFIIHPDLSFTMPTDGFDNLPTEVEGLSGDIEVDSALRQTYKTHPLAIIAGFLFSTDSDVETPEEFDVYHHNWSLRLRDAFSDDIFKRIHEIIRFTSGLSVDYVYLGHEAESVEIIDWIRDVMDTYGFRFGVNNQGKLTFYRAGLLEVDQYNSALENRIQAEPSAVLEQNVFADNASLTINADLPGFPWVKFQPIVATTKDEDEIQALPPLAQNNAADFDISMPTVENNSSHIEELVSRVLIQDFNAHELKILVKDHLIDTADYSLGSYALLDDIPVEKAWYWGFDGERIKDLGGEKIGGVVGLVIGRRYRPLQNAYELDLFINVDALVRWRTPSMVVDSSSSGTSGLTVVAQDVLGQLESSVAEFNVDDQLQVWSQDGTLLDSGIATIIDINADDSELIITDVWAHTLEQGDIIEFAHINSYEAEGFDGYYNPGAQGLDNIDRLYVFMSSEAPETTLGDEELDADQYGG